MEREHPSREPAWSVSPAEPPRAEVVALPTGRRASRPAERTDESTSDAIASRDISVVIPVYNEEGNLAELHARLTEVLSRLERSYEIVLIDDGSTDGTWHSIQTESAADEHLVAIRHRRNFGKAQALASGFAAARGDIVITMDGDLQDDPDELPRFLAKLDEGYDVVSGWKQRRQDPLGKTLPSRFFNLTVRRVSGVPLHDFNCGYKAYRRDVTRSIRLYGELHRFTPVLAHAEGFRIGELPVRHHARTWGRSKYGWSRLVKGFLDLLTVTFLTQYRQRPMHLFGLPGLMALAMGILIGLYLTLEKLISGAAIGGRPLLLLSVLLVVIGVQFFGLGLLGELHVHGSSTTRSDLRPFVRDLLRIDPEVLGVPGSAG
jgi:glycosyltransferase involved in cell wall biosynthesis